ncbi:MAG: hypothetical protein M3Q23_02260 [Actinomycetota bacterium]|nr:hypothetical protein [Actinomycetota bacterium]
MWVIDFWRDTVSRIDPATNREVAIIPLRLPFAVCEHCPGAHDFLPYDLATGAGGVWVTTGRGAVARIDPPNDSVAAYIRIRGETGDVAVAENRVWMSAGALGVRVIDPATNRVVEKIPIVDGRHPVQAGVTAFGGTLWAAGNDLRRTGDPGNPYELSSGGGGTVVRIDPVSARVIATIHVGQHVFLRAADQDSAWVLVGPPRRDDVYRIDAGDNRLSGPFHLPGALLAVGYGSGWVFSADHTIERVALPG